MNPSIFHENVEVYLARLAGDGSDLHPVFKEMQKLAVERTFPIVGPEVARFFIQIAMIKQPERILELGSGFGYSAICWALGNPNAEIHLTEFRQSNLDQAEVFAKQAGCKNQLHFHKGDALRSMNNIEGEFDLIFCDIDKDGYPTAVEESFSRLNKGGLFIIDNMLWSGKVAMDEGDWDLETERVVEATKLLYDGSKWQTSLLPVRDGVILAIK